MLSLVCAYNNEDKLKSELLSSLKFQKNVKYELILVNTVKENIKEHIIRMRTQCCRSGWNARKYRLYMKMN